MSCSQRFRVPSLKLEMIYTETSKEFMKVCQRFAVESRHMHPSSLRNERHTRKSERRNSHRTSAKWTTRRMAGLCDGMLVLLAQRPRWNSRWQDSILQKIWTINSLRNTGWVHPNHHERQVKNRSVLTRDAERKILLGYVLRAGGGWSGDLMIAGYEDLQESEAS